MGTFLDTLYWDRAVRRRRCSQMVKSAISISLAAAAFTVTVIVSDVIVPYCQMVINPEVDMTECK